MGLALIELADFGSPDHVLEQTARITLAIGLMGVALRAEAGKHR